MSTFFFPADKENRKKEVFLGKVFPATFPPGENVRFPPGFPDNAKKRGGRADEIIVRKTGSQSPAVRRFRHKNTAFHPAGGTRRPSPSRKQPRKSGSDQRIVIF